MSFFKRSAPLQVQDNLEFDSELQKLYVAVNTTINAQKSKGTDEFSSALPNNTNFVHEQSDQDHTSNVLAG